MANDPMLARIDELSGQFTAGQIDRRHFLKGLALLGLTLPAINLIVAACSSAASTPTVAPVASGVAGTADLIAAAKAEGSIYQTGIPPEWVNYQAIFDLWKQNYGITIDGTATEGEYSSGQELDSIKNTGKPDVGDVGISFAVQAKTESLSAPYKHSFWADVPDAAKDADGYWCCNYWGAQAFVVNTDAVKIQIKDWKRPARSVPQELNRHRRRPDQGERLVLRRLVGGHCQRRRGGQHPARHRFHEQAPAVGQPHGRPGERREHHQRRSQGRHQVGLPRPGRSR